MTGKKKSSPTRVKEIAGWGRTCAERLKSVPSSYDRTRFNSFLALMTPMHLRQMCGDVLTSSTDESLTGRASTMTPKTRVQCVTRMKVKRWATPETLKRLKTLKTWKQWKERNIDVPCTILGRRFQHGYESHDESWHESQHGPQISSMLTLTKFSFSSLSILSMQQCVWVARESQRRTRWAQQRFEEQRG